MICLKPTLHALFSEAPSPFCVRDFANLCHNMALIYLRKKVRRHQLCSTLAGLPLTDLAFDCIADLFQRDENGLCVKLVSYFGGIAWEGKSEVELAAATRRLVFSAVNDSLYRMYREADPSLGKLLRNLKLAIKSSPLFDLAERRGETWICRRHEGETTTALPTMPPEFLEAHLTASLRGEADVKQVLCVLAEILADQHEYCKDYPLTGLALIIRSAFVHLNTALEHESSGQDHFMPEETEKMITISTESVKSRMRLSYVGKQKIKETTYGTYFLAIREMLTAEYVRNDGFNRSYYDYLRQHIRELTREDYQDKYRCQFEYLAKLSRQELLYNLEKEC